MVFGTRLSRRNSFGAALAISFRLLLVALFLSVLPSGYGAAQAQTVDWLLNYEDATDPVAAGATVDYPATVTNNGTAAPATFIDLTVPNLTTMTGFLTPGAGPAIDNCRVVAVGATAPFAGGTPLPATTGERVICDVPALGFLETAGFTPQFLTSAPATPPESYQLTMTVLDEGGVDRSFTNNALTETTTVRAGSDLGILVDLPPTAASGSRVPFTVDVENFGPNDSNGYSFTFAVPPGFADLTLPAGCTQAGSTVTCTVGSVLAVSASTTFNFDALVVAGGGSDVSLSATVNGTTPDDPVGSNNSTSDQMLITDGTDVSVTISRDTGPEILSNTPVEFTLSPQYSGDAPDTVTITHTVPPQFTFVPGDIVAPGWTVGVSGNDLTFTRTLDPGAASGTDISLGDIVIPTTAVTPGEDIVSSVSVTSTGPVEQNPGNNTDTIETSILQPEVDLVADKTGPDPALAVVGLDYDFTLSASNEGNTAFDGTLVVRDVIPDTFAFSGASGPGWVCVLLPGAPPAGASGVVECTRDYTPGAPLAAGETAPPITVTLTATAEGVRNNRMEITTVNPNLPDANPANNIDDFEITTAVGGNSADIRVVKGVALDPLDAGEVQTYTLELINDDATQTSFDVTLTDRFTNLINNSVTAPTPGFEGFVISDPSGIATNLTCSTAASGGRARVLTCEADELAPCTAGSDCPVITVEVRHGTSATTIGNTADIISESTPDPDLDNNRSATSFSQNPLAEITVDKTVSAPTIEAGQNVIFIVTGQVENTGQSNADDFTITDTLPAGMRFISAISPQGACASVPNEGDIIVAGVNDELVCTYGSVSNAQQRTLTVTLQPTNDQIGDTLTNTAEVSTSTPEEGTLPNTASAETVVENPLTDIQINKDDSVDPLPIGSNTVYQIEVTNGGPSTSEDIVVTDTLPQAGLRFVSATIPAPGVCDSTGVDADGIGGEVVCTWPVLLEDDTFEILVEMEAVEAGDFPNSVEVSSFEILNGFDADALNNSNTENTTIRTLTDVGITKTTAETQVSVEQDFSFTLDVTVGSDTATDLLVEDTLPTGMVLTGTPSNAFLPAACTGAAGDTEFECDFGDVAAGTTIQIDVPVRVIAVSTNPETFENTAVVTTSSFDSSTGNDSSSASVDVVSSSIAGTFFRDFDNEGTQNLAADTGIEGVTMTLTGTGPGGRTITRTVETDASGDYLFDALPGTGWTYVITRGDPTDPLFTDGIDTVGSEGGTLAAPDAITAITVPDGVDAVDYDFAITPSPTIGLSKDLAAFALAADGSYTATFDLVVENLSSEPLLDIAVTDALSGGAPLFGTLVTLATPATDPLADGTYAIVSTGSGSCGGFNAGFNGAGDQTLASGVTLPVGGTCTISFTIRVQPTDPVPLAQPSGAQYENQAAVTGEGEFTGLPVSDLSDDGTVIDGDGNLLADEAGENDPTPITLDPQPSVALLKEVDISGLSSPAEAGDPVTYTFSVRNTGNVTLTNVTVTDPLPGLVLSGAPIPSLAPGETVTAAYTGAYSLTPGDIAAGNVDNQALVTGTPPSGPDVTDDSGTAFDNDDPTSIPLGTAPAIDLIKTADTSALQDPPQVGDIVTFRFTVRNTGNVALTDVTVTDPLPGLTLTGAPIPSLAAGAEDSTTFVGTYALTEDDLTAGEVENTASVTGDPPAGPPETDDDTETVPLAAEPGITLDKIITDQSDLDDGAQVGDQIFYAFTVTNTGNVPLRDVTVTDPLPGIVLSGAPIPLMNPAAAADGTDVDTTTYTAVYTLTQTDVDNGGRIENTATVTGTFGPLGAPLTVDDDDTVVASPPDPSDGLTLTKVTPDEVIRRGVIAPYTIRLRNDNTFAVTGIDLIDTLPEGLIFVPGSAELDGVPFPVTVSGQTITFAGLDVPPGTERVATLNARVLNSANPGIYVNSVLAFDPPFGVIAGPATASVRILPEAVFDCSDVIGRVFDDLDADGFQDAYDPNAISAAVIDPEAKIEEVASELTDEIGLSGVRLVTLDGLVITTDANGLFSVPCAALPADIGSNFLLSLDERSLPLGYEMTTQNPRVVRLTPGVMTELNFGARLAQRMRVDLSAQAFANGLAVSPEMQQGIAAMVARLIESPSTVELVFHVSSNAGPEAVARGRDAMALVAAEIDRQWSGAGFGRLRIEQTIARGEN
ncbi:DUF7507 domain-containing protein [Gymnodinialimonas ulvae]|uniref:DUF7507 domain-containing protein n=1 Tax=Gymnodinialimonas ulvae TaxID=3126504 RepID=UPI0030B6DB57